MTNEYWARRARRRMDEYQRRGEEALREIERAHKRALLDLEEDIERIGRSFVKRYALKPEEARELLDAPAGPKEYEELRRRIAGMPEGDEKRAMLARAASGAYSYRMKRLEALKADIRVQTAAIAQSIAQELEPRLKEVARQEYEEAGKQLEARAGISFETADAAKVEELLRQPWFGGDYSTRIWKNREALQELLEEAVTSGFLNGRSYRRIAQEVRDTLGVSMYNAERLVRTELSYMANQAAIKRYKDKGIERYRYMSALDKIICDKCGELDGQSFPVSEAKAGVNLPPMHPFCRCTTVAVLEGAEGKRPSSGRLAEGESDPEAAAETSGATGRERRDDRGGVERKATLGRRARDEKGKSVILPGDMTYEEYAQWVKDGYAEDVEKWLQDRREDGTISAQGNTLTNDQKQDAALQGDDSRGFYNSSREMPHGLRQPRAKILTPQDIAYLKDNIKAIQADESVFLFNEGTRTAYYDDLDIITVRGDVLPAVDDSTNARDQLSSRAVLAHEYYGHRTNRNTRAKSSTWNDEFRASYTAAVISPGLSDKDRTLLMRDALNRAADAGITIKLNAAIRRILYGYE